MYLKLQACRHRCTYISIPHYTHMVYTLQIEYFVVLFSTVLFVRILQCRWYKKVTKAKGLEG